MPDFTSESISSSGSQGSRGKQQVYAGGPDDEEDGRGKAGSWMR